MADDTDQALIDASRGGDRRALEKLLEKHQGAVYRFGMKMCGEPEDAKDVLQETLFAAARNLPDFRGASSISTWLYTIARSFCVKKRRTSKFAPARIESLEAQADASAELPDPRGTPEENAASRQMREVLNAAIAELDPRYREVLAEASPGCQDAVLMLSRRLEGEIDASACAALEAHLEKCASCRGRCDSLRATLTLCRAAGTATVPPDVERSVRAALRQFVETNA